MDRAVLAGIAAGIVSAGLILSPLSIDSLFSTVQADHQGGHKKVTLVADEMVVKVASDYILHPGGIMYNAMVFNGTIPGPVIAVDQGDTLEITLINEGNMIHSLDFHAGIGPSNALSGNVAPNETKTWTLKAVNAGAFLYHCNADALNGVWEHIANGMYGGIVVHPLYEKPAKEFYIVFGEIYNNADGGPFIGSDGKVGSFDLDKLWNNSPDLILTNGMAFRYACDFINPPRTILDACTEAEYFKVRPGELTRWYVVNPGPNGFVAFNFIGGMIDVRDGSVKDRFGTQFKNDETWTIPPGSASIIEATFPDEGVYGGWDHNMSRLVKGGIFIIIATGQSTERDHPEGTMVTPRGGGQSID